MGKPNQLFTFRQLRARKPSQRAALKRRAIKLIDSASNLFSVIIVSNAKRRKAKKTGRKRG
jgi:hypothetical protein